MIQIQFEICAGNKMHRCDVVVVFLQLAGAV